MKIKPTDYNNVLDYFYTHNDNRTSVIAHYLDLSLFYTSYIIDFHLSLKRNYMGEPILLKENRIKKPHHACIKVRVTDGFGDFIGEYKSYKQCAEALGILKEELSKKLQGIKRCRISHRFGKTYNYEKI